MPIFTLRTLGAVMVSTAIVLSALLFTFLDSLSDMSAATCTCGDSCGMVEFQVPLVFYLGLAGVVAIFVIGALIILKGGEPFGAVEGKRDWNKVLERLEGEHRLVYKLMMDEGGAIFQSENVERTDLSKVKVTRVLDKLESLGLAERRRRGLTNMVILK